MSRQAAANGASATLGSGGGPLEVFWAFLRLGCLSFGGPIAHIGYFRSEFVDRRRWLDDAEYADTMALCQFLPGPSSSQVVFALGMRRAGAFGAVAASLAFTLPSALLMIGFAYGVARAGALSAPGFLHGLKLAAVAVVAQAVWNMGRALWTDRARISLGLAAGAALIAVPSAVTQLAVIACGGLAGYFLHRGAQPPPSVGAELEVPASRRLGATLLVVFGLLLSLLPLAAASTGVRALQTFDAFYRSGSLVFGGGHVVLPLLRAELVPRGWLSDDQFLAGYGAAQALPGPLFTFAAYLGTAMATGPYRFLHGVLCLLALFLPGWLLVGGVLPYWHRLRAEGWARAALAGANASVVGVLLSALYQPVIRESVRGPLDAVIALVAFGLLERGKLPPWLVVLGSAAAGRWLA